MGIDNRTNEQKKMMGLSKLYLFFAQEKEYKLEEENFKYKNTRQKVKVKHLICGNTWCPTINNLVYSGTKCPYCFSQKKTNNIKLRFKEIFETEKDYQFIEEGFEYKNKKQKILIKHLSCGNTFNPSVGHFVYQNSRCPFCKNKKAKKKPQNDLESFFENNKEYKLIENNFAYIGNKQKIKIKHLACGKVWNPNIDNLLHKRSRCPNCSNRISKPETEICDFVISLGVKVEPNTRSIISPLELDIYCPDQKVAIEYNGFHWHGENQKSKNYHRNKTELCAQKGIQLIHIFPDEWREKKEIVKSVICNKLGLCENKIFARKCEIKNIDNRESNVFFSTNHIAGPVRCKKSFGLYFNDELVAAISYRFPLQKKKYPNCMEIARFATKLNGRVVGAFGKLLKTSLPWLREEKIGNILSYADLRYGTGKVYEALNFSLLGKTDLDYWYTDGISRFNRFKFRAKKPLTEKEVATKNRVWKIYGCGNKKYCFRIY